jgi:hypothetical protein
MNYDIHKLYPPKMYIGLGKIFDVQFRNGSKDVSRVTNFMELLIEQIQIRMFWNLCNPKKTTTRTVGEMTVFAPD